MATTKTFSYANFDQDYLVELKNEMLGIQKEAPKKPKNIYEDKYKAACETIDKLHKRIFELNEGLTQRELRIIVNRALKQKGVPAALPLRKYASKTAFVSALSNALFELAQVPDPDKLP